MGNRLITFFLQILKAKKKQNKSNNYIKTKLYNLEKTSACSIYIYKKNPRKYYHVLGRFGDLIKAIRPICLELSNILDATKTFDHTTIADWLRTVS